MGEIEKGTGGRPGAPWGPFKGRTSEANDLAQMLRQWLDSSELRVKDFHAKLEPVDFDSGKVPSLDTVYNRFAAVSLDWDFASAVVHHCSADGPTMNKRLKEAQRLWSRVTAAERALRERKRAERRARPPVVEVPATLKAPDSRPPGQLLIEAYDKMDGMRQAHSLLQTSYHRLEMIAFLLLAKGEKDVQRIIELEGKLAAALAAQAPDPAKVTTYEVMIDEARAEEEDTARARYEAEDSQDLAGQMLLRANQEIIRLKAEIDRLKAALGLSAQRTAERVGDVLDDGLQNVGGAIDEIQHILEEEHDQLHRLRESLGWRLADDESPSRLDDRTIIGEVVRPRERPEGTATPDNPPTSAYRPLTGPDNPPREPDNPHRPENPATPDNPPTSQDTPRERPENPTTPNSPPTGQIALKEQPGAPAAGQKAASLPERMRHLATAGNQRARTALTYLPRLIAGAISISWAIVIGTTFTEIRRGPASLLSIILSALAGLLLLGCFKLWIHTVAQRGMTRRSDPFSDSLFIGTTQQRQLLFHVRPPTPLQALGLLAGLLVPDHLGLFHTLGHDIAHLIGMA
ncbi:hypothetical protein Kpho02_67940 [Kitasatospora phosalacinea]|uniref:Uncharacterized protein n=1 Tax=Kitasatospora phosalacinea TaxID=2065 RepID=A0A9W6QGE5_9ACTN|nr:hypothetical protein [Kitasatospora phosalacinea]GLW74496.1 hypothetical protein Kpho02_67940 [Kitasatospora phosalacinea]